MKKIIYILSSFAILTSCNKLKEQDMKNMFTDKKVVSTEDSVALAEKSPTFENLTAAGVALAQAKQTEKAISYFEKALSASPKNSVAFNNLCAENNNLGHFEKAISYCEQAITISPDFQLAKNNLKFAQDKKALQLKLIEELKAKSETTKGKVRRTHLVDLGFEYYKMGNYDGAIAIWKKVPKSNDALYARTLNNLGSAYIITKKFDLAKSSLEEASQLEPQNQLIKNNMAWLQSEMSATAK